MTGQNSSNVKEHFEEIYEKMNKETAQFVKDRYEFCLSKRKTFEEKPLLGL